METPHRLSPPAPLSSALKSTLALVLGLALLLLPPAARAADPVVANLTAAQRAGTTLVDISYGVTAATPTPSTRGTISGSAWPAVRSQLVTPMR